MNDYEQGKWPREETDEHSFFSAPVQVSDCDALFGTQPISQEARKVPMKTLDQHNAERRDFQAKMRDAQYHTGIACPDCGRELLRTNPNTLCLTLPPQINVHCDCGYRGYAVA